MSFFFFNQVTIIVFIKQYFSSYNFSSQCTVYFIGTTVVPWLRKLQVWFPLWPFCIVLHVGSLLLLPRHLATVNCLSASMPVWVDVWLAICSKVQLDFLFCILSITVHFMDGTVSSHKEGCYGLICMSSKWCSKHPVTKFFLVPWVPPTVQTQAHSLLLPAGVKRTATSVHVWSLGSAPATREQDKQ